MEDKADGERQQTLSAGEGDLRETRQTGRDNRHCLLEKGICGRQGRRGETTDIVCWRRGSVEDKADGERQQTLSAGEGDLWKTRQTGRDNRRCLLEKGICGRQGRQAADPFNARQLWQTHLFEKTVH